MKRSSIVALVALLLLVIAIVGVVSVWHSRPGRVQVHSFVSVECAGADIYLGDVSVGVGEVTDHPLSSDAPYALMLEPGWTEFDLVGRVKRELPAGTSARVVRSGTTNPRGWRHWARNSGTHRRTGGLDRSRGEWH